MLEYIWKWRNVYVFGKTNEILGKTGNFLLIRFGEVLNVWGYESLLQAPLLVIGKGKEIAVCYGAPPEGWALLNTNGASKRKPGCGRVITGFMGEWIKGFSENFGVCISVKVTLRKLRVVYLLGIRKPWFQKDIMIIVEMLRGNGMWNPIHKLLIMHCKVILEHED